MSDEVKLAWSTADAELHQLLECTLRPRNFQCPSPSGPVVVDELYCGAGCSLSFLIKPLLFALAEGKRFSVPASRFAMGEPCTGSSTRRRSACFFRGDESTHGEIASDAVLVKQDWEGQAVSPASAQAGSLPGAAAIFYSSWFALVARLLASLTQPSDRMRQHVQHVAGQLGIDDELHRPLLSLHVRQGDACSDPEAAKSKGRAQCLGLDAYAPYVDAMIRAHDYKAIYIATDSEEVVQDATRRWHLNATAARTLRLRDPLRVLFQPIDRSRYAIFASKQSIRQGWTIEKLLWAKQLASTRQQLNVTPAREMEEFMTDLYLLARADGFVGSFTSNMDRVAYALSSAYAASSTPCLKPFASLGGFWCSDFSRRSGRADKKGGEFDC